MTSFEGFLDWFGTWIGRRGGSRGLWRAAPPAAGPWPPFWQLSGELTEPVTAQTSPSGEPPSRQLHRIHAPADLLAIAPHLTDRDLMIASWLDRHGVFTTTQLAQAFFRSPSTAAHRLGELRRLHWVQRFHRPRPGGGFTAWHWVIGPLGAHWHAAAIGEHPPTPAALRRRWARLAASPILGHQLGTHQFFIDLHAPIDATTGTPTPSGLLGWWLSAGESAEAFLRRVHPDGTGRYGHVRFFLEHDTGSENIREVARKLRAYEALRSDGGPGWPILFHLPHRSREDSLHRALDTRTGVLPVATAIHGEPPGGPVWRLAGHDGPRRYLTQLPCQPAANDLYGGQL